MGSKSAIHILPDNEGGFFLDFIDQKAFAQIDAGERFETVEVTTFRALRHEGQTIANLVIELEDGIPSSVSIV